MCYPYHDLRPLKWDHYPFEALLLYSARGAVRATQERAEDEKLLAEIASAPEESDPPEDRPPAKELY